ncbi:hypothetical protein DXG01_006534 [Tephrocybe rancida]|nr:hypothetical protein DXG01_006534 [Tephrocybe rancida]
MCRHELATREHMLDHGELSPATPAVMTPATSRRPSATARTLQGVTNIDTSELRPRRPSHLGLGNSLSMSSIATTEPVGNGFGSAPTSRRSSGDKPSLRNLPEIPHAEDGLESSSALESDDEEVPEQVTSPAGVAGGALEMSHQTARIIGRRMSDAVLSPRSESAEFPVDSLGISPVTSGSSQPSLPLTEKAHPTTYINPADLAAELYSDPKLAALRIPHGPPVIAGMSPIQPVSKVHHNPPILANPKCSGYFVEPMKWMEPFLSSGQLSGKIVCPNTKCGAKLGSYDWAGVCCGCKEWVTPGFCISRSKVDEIVK